ncbi:energy-coupled thiamine transporter ThiT [Streptococcus jiangjianxini]|uniref:energy-coupled thiamine transporter ThiT n=1 Tax=Streptococcus jiangjianxini TaxID=3161189 RepID=UPI0032ED1218
MSKNLNVLVEAAIFAALAMVLSFIPDFASWFTPSFGAIPLVVFALRRGSKYGLLSGLLWGLLHFVLGKVYYLAFSQVLIEYILAFVSMGLAGIFANSFQTAIRSKQTKTAIITGLSASLLAVGVRYFWHFLAGVIFWGSYAPKGMSALWYSMSVNGVAGLATLILVLISLILLVSAQANRIFLPK